MSMNLPPELHQMVIHAGRDCAASQPENTIASPISQKGEMNEAPTSPGYIHESAQLNTTKKFVRSHAYKVYGTKAAIDVNCIVRRPGDGVTVIDQYGEVAGFHTLLLEAAPKLQGFNRKFDWKNKVAIQLTSSELPLFVATCYGFLNKIQFSNHGMQFEKNKKYFSLEFQGMKGFIRIGQFNGTQCAVPISLPCLNDIAMRGLGQMGRNNPSLDTYSILVSLKMMASNLAKNGHQSIKDSVPTAPAQNTDRIQDSQC